MLLPDSRMVCLSSAPWGGISESHITGPQTTNERKTVVTAALAGHRAHCQRRRTEPQVEPDPHGAGTPEPPPAEQPHGVTVSTPGHPTCSHGTPCPAVVLGVPSCSRAGTGGVLTSHAPRRQRGHAGTEGRLTWSPEPPPLPGGHGGQPSSLSGSRRRRPPGQGCALLWTSPPGVLVSAGPAGRTQVKRPGKRSCST